MGLRLFEELDGDVFTVFRDKGLLGLSYVPDVLMGRGVEEERLARILTRGVAEDFLPPVVRVFGRPGSGKTAVVRSVLERFERYRGDVFRHFYVNLKGSRTIFSAGNAVLSAICGSRVPVNMGLDRAFEEIWRALEALRGRGVSFICLVLDEVDSIFMDRRHDPSDFLYRFIRHHVYLAEDLEICLILVTNNPLTLDENLDGRVRSSMGGEMMIFSSYSRSQMTRILGQRLEAFKPGMVGEGVVERCAELIAEKSGDARRAIDLLRASGEVANEWKSGVTVECVNAAMERVERDWIQEQLRDLPAHMAFILGFISYLSLSRESFSTRELYGLYRSADIEAERSRTLSQRRILGIINELDTMGLIRTWNVSRGRHGYRKEMKINIDPHTVLNYYRDSHPEYTFQITRK